LVVKINNMSSKFATPFFQKSPLQGAYASGADAMVTTSVAPYFDKLQQDIGTAVSKSLMKPVDKCAQLDERLATNKIGIDAYNRSKKNCAEKTSTSTSTASSNSIGTMPADLNALANKGKNTKTNTSTSSPGIYDVLAKIAKPIQDKAVTDIKNILDPKRNNQIQEED